MSSDSDNGFSDDEEDINILLSDIKSIKQQQGQTNAVNKSFTTLRTGQSRISNSGELRMNGSDIEYEEIRETNVLFSATHHDINRQNTSTYIYPTNYEVRDYQFDIVSKSLFQNLLCSLPTGLGKTLIASTVMLNFYRWTRNSKIIFMAPTKPLVAQQIKAFIGITGVSTDDIAILLDKTKRNRAEIWNNRRIFFTTPQVVDNDLKNGLVDPKSIVCLIIDEAHRARGNYAYVNVAQYIFKFNTSFRILALTATPGSTIEAIQEIINSLKISKIEMRTEDNSDIKKYIKQKEIVKFDCETNSEIEGIVDLISEAILPQLKLANSSGIYDITDPAKINHFRAMEQSQRVIKNPTLSEGIKWTYYYRLQLLGTVGQFLRRINIYGIKTFYAYFVEKIKEFTTKYENKKSTNKIAASFYYDEHIKTMKKNVEKLIADDDAKAIKGESIKGMFSHTKLNYLVEELMDFFKVRDGNSSVIIFTEFRENALEIVKCIESANLYYKSPDTLRPHIFIGQAKEKEKFDEQKFLSKGKKNKNKNKKKKEEEDSSNDPTPRNTNEHASTSEMAQLKGMNQSLQKQLIEEFKQGKFNILVATSIGEEGLDIGEVDLIVCFDSTSSPIKNIQRMGRTGRKRDGKVILLFSSNERDKFDKAMDNYQFIQNQLRSSNDFTLIKSDRILPSDCNPKVEYKKIVIPEESLALLENKNESSDAFLKLMSKVTTSKKGAFKKVTTAKGKKKEKIQRKFNMPDNVEIGFRKVSQMVKVKGTDRPLSEEIENKKRKPETSVKEKAPVKLGDTISFDDSDSDEEAIKDIFSQTLNKCSNNTFHISKKHKNSRIIDSESDAEDDIALITRIKNGNKSKHPKASLKTDSIQAIGSGASSLIINNKMHRDKPDACVMNIDDDDINWSDDDNENSPPNKVTNNILPNIQSDAENNDDNDLSIIGIGQVDDLPIKKVSINNSKSLKSQNKNTMSTNKSNVKVLYSHDEDEFSDEDLSLLFNSKDKSNGNTDVSSTTKGASNIQNPGGFSGSDEETVTIDDDFEIIKTDNRALYSKDYQIEGQANQVHMKEKSKVNKLLDFELEQDNSDDEISSIKPLVFFHKNQDSKKELSSCSATPQQRPSIRSTPVISPVTPKGRTLGVAKRKLHNIAYLIRQRNKIARHPNPSAINSAYSPINNDRCMATSTQDTSDPIKDCKFNSINSSSTVNTSALGFVNKEQKSDIDKYFDIPFSDNEDDSDDTKNSKERQHSEISSNSPKIFKSRFNRDDGILSLEQFKKLKLKLINSGADSEGAEKRLSEFEEVDFHTLDNPTYGIMTRQKSKEIGHSFETTKLFKYCDYVEYKSGKNLEVIIKAKDGIDRILFDDDDKLENFIVDDD